MEILNTQNFQKFIVKQDIDEVKTRAIEQIIEAFAEYIEAVNQDYVYNKTYLNTYVEGFIQCQKALKSKYRILQDNILKTIHTYGVENECVISIDEAWIYKNGKIILSNFINPYIVKSNKVQVKIELMHENGFVIAEEIKLDGDYKKKLDKCISVFIDRRKELLK